MQEIIRAESVLTEYQGKIIHNHVSFHVNEGEIYGFLGGSGAGKTTLMKTLNFLVKPTSGKEYVLGKDIWSLSFKEQEELRLKTAFMFQFGALYSSMSVLENVSVLLKEYSNFSKNFIEDLAMFWIEKVGLNASSAKLYPSELSGGMVKRVALARALALSPKILFLDEPNSGLDPLSAREFDALLKNIRASLNITIVMVTHDVDSIFDILDRFLIIDEHKIIFEGNIKEVAKVKNNPLEELFKMRGAKLGK